MKKVLLLLFAGLTLSGCMDSYSGDVEKYKRAHDRYMDSHQPKTGGPDI
jgi:PBP1b-binding outer membrane lipoprotein LpoB